MIYHKKPSNFNPKFEVVSCFVEHDGKILLLHRHDNKPQGNTWGAPAGKVDGEDLTSAIIREVFEEIGVRLNDVSYFGKAYVRYPEYDFVYHIFHKKLDYLAEIILNPAEHMAYRWVTPKESLMLNLIRDEDYCIKWFYGL